MKTLTIGQAAQRAGVGVETIRFYERKGLIRQPQRPKTGGYRDYSGDIVGRIRFIRQAQDLGFSLRDVADLLGLRADPDSDCAQVQKRAREKLDEVERKVARLRDIGASLRQVIAACPSRGGLDGCSIIAAMEDKGEIATTG